MTMQSRKKAQGITEYAIFIAAVLAGLLALQVYFSRSVKGGIKSKSDSIGQQFDANIGASYNKETRSVSGRMVEQNTGSDYWSKSTVVGNTTATSFSKQKIDALKANIEGLNIGARYVNNVTGWQGGELSSSEYVDDQGNHGYYTRTSVSASGNSVWQESGIN